MRIEKTTEYYELGEEIVNSETGEVELIPNGEMGEITVTTLYAEQGKRLCRNGVRLGTCTVLGTADSVDAYSEVE